MEAGLRDCCRSGEDLLLLHTMRHRRANSASSDRQGQWFCVRSDNRDIDQCADASTDPNPTCKPTDFRLLHLKRVLTVRMKRPSSPSSSYVHPNLTFLYRSHRSCRCS